MYVGTYVAEPLCSVSLTNVDTFFNPNARKFFSPKIYLFDLTWSEMRYFPTKVDIFS
jgi:hypothetical protein